MKIFVTGATGFVGSAVVAELIGSGHQVLGLARSESSAQKLREAGAEVQAGSLDDLESLRSGATVCDAVIHTAFNHDFSKFLANCEEDRLAIETLGSAFDGTDRPLLVTSGLALLAPGRIATEDDLLTSKDFPRKSESAAAALVERGINASVVRLPPSVHGEGDHGFVPILIDMAKEKGVSAYIGQGLNRWPGVHRVDAAKVYRLAIERAVAGINYHAVDDEGVHFKEIAAAIGKGLNVPVVSKSAEEAPAHFTWFAMFAGIDAAASSAWTREVLGWEPMQPGLLDDIANAGYFSG